jgi:hypothetical protein
MKLETKRMVHGIVVFGTTEDIVVWMFISIIVQER